MVMATVTRVAIAAAAAIITDGLADAATGGTIIAIGKGNLALPWILSQRARSMRGPAACCRVVVPQAPSASSTCLATSTSSR
jgi:hypothetical protein